MSSQRIFITGTMRTGSSLISNALSVHSKILVLSDSGVHFFRFLYKRYEPLTETNVHRMLLHLKARLRYRFNIDFDAESIMQGIRKRAFTYPVIYDEIMKSRLKGTKKEIWGDDPALQWREIPAFLEFFPNGKVIHIYRDPRAVLTSWKKASFAPDNGYLNAIFNCIDSLNFVNEFSKSLSNRSYFPLKYEDLTEEPEKWLRKICDFLEVDFEEIMIQPEKWEESLKGASALGWSSFDGQVVGFSTKRANRWKEIIEGWEVCFLEAIAGDILTRHGYELSSGKFSASDFALALEKIRKNEFLLKQFYTFLSTGTGTDQYPKDPTDYRNWNAPGAPDKPFIDFPVAKEYLKEIAQIEKLFAKV